MSKLEDLTEKQNPVATDLAYLTDSESDNESKKTTLSAIKRAVLGYREYVARVDLDSQAFDSVTELKNELSETTVSVEVETITNIEVHVSFSESFSWDKISISTAGGYSESAGDISAFFDGFLESANNDTIGLSIQPIGSEIPGDSPLSFYVTVRIYY